VATTVRTRCYLSLIGLSVLNPGLRNTPGRSFDMEEASSSHLALLALSTVSGVDFDQVSAFEVLPSSVKLDGRSAELALDRVPKPTGCSATIIENTLQIRCSPIGAELGRLRDFRAGLIRDGRGPIGTLRLRAGDQSVEIRAAGKVTSARPSTLERWATEYLIEDNLGVELFEPGVAGSSWTLSFSLIKGADPAAALDSLRRRAPD